MTDRHPLDCLLTPPAAARAILQWLYSARDPWAGIYHELSPGPLYDGAPWLDPFAGAGTLLEWGLLDPCGEREVHAWELDTRWEGELRSRIPALNIRLGRDSFAMDWMARAQRPHILTNPPYQHAHLAVERAAQYARTHKRWVCMLLRTDLWQHSLPPAEHFADYYLSLRWRPSFGLNKHGKPGTESGGSQWCVWSPFPPERDAVRSIEFIERPQIPDEWHAEHRRLARLAYQMGHEPQGATP